MSVRTQTIPRLAFCGAVSLLLFTMLCFPMVLQLLYPKAVLIGALAVAAIMVWAKTGSSNLDTGVVLATLSLAGFGFLMCIRGLFLGNPGALKSAQVFVFWPLVYLVLISGIRTRSFWPLLERVIVLSTIFIGLYGVALFLSEVQVLPEISLLKTLSFEDDLAVGLYEGFVRLLFPGLNSTPFLLPFLMAVLVTDHDRSSDRIGRLWVWIALFLGLVIVLISGRKAFFVVIVAVPIQLILIHRFLPAGRRKLATASLKKLVIGAIVAAGIALVLLSLVYGLKVSAMWDYFKTGFDFSATTADDGAGERRTQFFALISGWLQNPLIGAGIGASAYGSIRSDTMPWAYELTYLALLFQIGLFGLAVYAMGILWIWRKAINVVRAGGYLAEFAIPSLIGMTSYLIATATNPYLTRFDGLWIIFVPLAIINVFELAAHGKLA